MNVQGKRYEDDDRCHYNKLEQQVIADEVGNSGIHHVPEGQSHLDEDASERAISWTNRLHYCIHSLQVHVTPAKTIRANSVY